MNRIEILGIIASVFIVFSIVFKTTSFKGTILMRSINLIGSSLFAVYGSYMRAYSLVITNIIAIVISIYYLIQETRWHRKDKLKEM